MFRATISAPQREPLRLCGHLTPYDLQTLREHVLARRGRGTRVEVRLAPAHRDLVLRALGDLERFGIELVLVR